MNKLRSPDTTNLHWHGGHVTPLEPQEEIPCHQVSDAPRLVMHDEETPGHSLYVPVVIMMSRPPLLIRRHVSCRDPVDHHSTSFMVHLPDSSPVPTAGRGHPRRAGHDVRPSGYHMPGEHINFNKISMLYK